MYWSALTIGIIGGLHCSLMCSPLLAAIFTKGKLNSSFLIYQLGRIITYFIIASIFYVLGEGFQLLGFQQLFSLIIAAYVLYFYLLPSSWRKFKWLEGIESKPYQLIKQSFQKYLKNNGKKARFIQGLFNGLLPCGLVYLAVANSLLADNYIESVISMLIFGLATIPWLVGAFFIIKAPVFIFTKYIKKIKPALVLLIVCFLMLRGLGIDYIHLPMPQSLSNKSEIIIPICGGSENLKLPD